MVRDLAEPDLPRWDHVEYHFEVSVGCGSSEETNECDGHKCYRWHTYG